MEGDITLTGAEALVSEFDRAPLNGRYWLTFGLLSCGAVLDFFDVFIVGYLIAQLGPIWHLTYGESSAILLAAGIGAIVSALCSGALSDALGRKRQIVLGYLICAIGAGGIAFIPSGAWQLLALLRVAVGFGQAAASVPALTMITEITPTRARTVVTGLWVATGSIGLLTASALGATLYNALGWRTVAAIGVAPAFIAGLVLLFVPESVRWLVAKGRFAEARTAIARHLGVGVETLPLPSRLPANPPRASLSELWTKPKLAFLVIVTTCGAATVDYAVILWGPTIFSLSLKISVEEAARYFLLVVVAGFIGKVMFSILPHYFGRRRTGQIHGFCLALGIALAGCFHSTLISGFPLFVVLLVMTNVFMQGGITNLAPYSIEIFGVRLGARAAGLSQAANGVGKVLGPLLLAWVAGTGNMLTPKATDHAIMPAFLILSVFALAIGLAFTFLGPETHGKVLALGDPDDVTLAPVAAVNPTDAMKRFVEGQP